jgi:hypothetical protein
VERTKINDDYEVVIDWPNGVFHCLRHGESWRSLIGDNMALAMIHRIQELEEENLQLKMK